MVPEVSSTQLADMIQSDQGQIHLVDVRSEAEVAYGAIPDAQHLPLHLLPMRMDELARDKRIVLYCRSGARSFQACQFLRQNGYDQVFNLNGGIISWAQQGLPVVQD